MSSPGVLEQKARWEAGIRWRKQPDAARFPRDEKHLGRRLQALGPFAYHELARQAAMDSGGHAAQRIAKLAKARARRRRKRPSRPDTLKKVVPDTKVPPPAKTPRRKRGAKK